jgi:predicted ATPase
LSTPEGQLTFEPPLPEFLEERSGQPLTVLAGANNTGKSLVLKWSKSQLGRTAYMIGANRFYHVYHISTALRDPNELDQWNSNFMSQYLSPQYNYEQNFIDLSRIITGLGDTRRNLLFETCAELLETPFALRKVEEDNELSMRYVEVGGQNISVASSGARLLMTLLGICMDERFETILIDEPELGLSPRVQERLSAFFQDPTRRATLFPHLKRIFIATHSHLFLAQTLTDNYVVSKTDATVTLARIKTTIDLHRLQFNLLGNSFEAMFLPAAIVVVEGQTDFNYLDRVVQLQLPTRRVTVIAAGGDVKRKIHGLREAFGDLQRSPFRGRVFVVLDSVHQPGLTAELVGMGLLRENVITWSRNGIEYLYPPALVAESFGGSHAISIDGDRVCAGGVVLTKAQLGEEVCRKLDASTELPAELHEKLLDPIISAID